MFGLICSIVVSALIAYVVYMETNSGATSFISFVLLVGGYHIEKVQERNSNEIQALREQISNLGVEDLNA